MTQRDWMMMLTLSVLWGGSFLFVEIGLEALSAVQVVWLRVALAALVLAGALPLMGVSFPRRAQWPALMGMSVLNNILPFTLIAIAQGEITGSLASVLNATTPLFTLVIAHMATTDERITPTKAVGLITGFLGVVVMLSVEFGEANTVTAMLCSLAAAVSYGFAAVYGRRFKRMGLSPMTTAFGQVAGSAVLMAPVVALTAPLWEIAPPGLRVVEAMLALAVLSTAAAYFLFFRILESAGATNLSIVTFLIPVSATALGSAFLGERLLPEHIAGFVLVCLGLAIIDGRVVRWLQR